MPDSQFGRSEVLLEWILAKKVTRVSPLVPLQPAAPC